ncbi:MAG: ACT domain-containing protein [Candidatus Micrarchaeia archaeon]
MKEITVFVPNKVGALAEVAEVLGENGINIISVSAVGIGEKGVIRLITSDEKSAINVLAKYLATKTGGGYEMKIGDVIIVKLVDRPGELAKVCRKLARANINLEAVYLLREKDGVEVAIKPEKLETAIKELKKVGIEFRV